MNDDLRARLMAEIKSSGFPWELRTLAALREHGYLVSPNLHFHDVHRQMHEIDILGFRVDAMPQGWECGPVQSALVIECKQSAKKPWVFFDDSRNLFGLDGLTPRVRCLTDLTVKNAWSPLVGCSSSALAGHHLNCDLPRARTYFEAFKNHDRPTDIFRAAESMCYGIDFVDRWFRQSASGPPGRTLAVYGVIALEGTLCLASFPNGELCLSETPHLVLRVTDCFTQTTNSPIPGNEVIVDVVRADYLEDFLALCSRDHGFLVEHMMALQHAGWLTPPQPRSETTSGKSTG